MWMQPPPPVDDRWVLHIAATPHQVDEVLAELCIHQRAKAAGDPDMPAYLAGRYSPGEPPAWMSFARAELESRGYRTRWCEPDCAHHPSSPRTAPTRSGKRGGRTPLHRLSSGAPHHRTAVPAQRAA